MHSRREFLGTMGMAAAAAPLLRATGTPSEQRRLPNIVVILADDMGYGDLSCQSIDSKIHTPNMDRLAAQGMRFTDAHSSSAVCTPSRYSLLTGQYDWRSRLKRYVQVGYDPPLIPQDRMTVASLLKKHGYSTACMGKWHLGMGWRTKDGQVTPWKDGKSVADAHPLIDFDKPLAVTPNNYGFDYSFVFPAALDMPPYCWVENDRVVKAPTDYTKGGNTFETGYWRPGPIAPGFNHVEILPELTQRAVNYIHGHAGASAQTPFFLYLPINGPHWPIAPAPAYRGSSQAGVYGDFMVQIDHSVGAVMDALEKNGIADDTLVILTSDNGSPALLGPDDEPLSVLTKYGHYANANLRGIKADIWDGGHREPFIARWPRHIAPGSVNAETVCLTDLMATVAALLGEKLPENAGEDSCNLLPSMLHGRRTGNGERQTTIHHSSSGMYAIRNGPWKLNFGLGGGGWTPCAYQPTQDEPEGELFNMDEDIGESKNLYAAHSDMVRELTEHFNEIRFQGHS
jgi:arylsulfatase A-like enzyme